MRFMYLFALSTAMMLAQAQAQDVIGVWRTEATDQGVLEVEIAPCGAALCGTIRRARDLSGTEQPYAHVGRVMIRDMMPSGAAKWSDGKIWDPRNDRTFNARMELVGGQLNVSGCLLGLCQQQAWTRAN